MYKASDIIRQARESLGWTQYRLAKESGVQRRHLALIERGTVDPSVGLFVRLLTAMGKEFIVK